MLDNKQENRKCRLFNGRGETVHHICRCSTQAEKSVVYGCWGLNNNEELMYIYIFIYIYIYIYKLISPFVDNDACVEQ